MAKKHYFKLSKILQQLLYDRRMNASELAREVKMPVPTIHRLVTGKSTRPYASSLKPIADYFSLEVAQLIGDKPLPTAAFASPEKNQHIIQLPLLEWEDLSNLQPSLTSAKKMLPALSDLSEKCFAIAMNDSSMEPQFSKDTILILDPEKTPADRSFTLVKLTNSNLFVFRQLMIDADHQFIKPLNPDLSASHMRLLDDNDEIIAVLVEARQVYNNF